MNRVMIRTVDYHTAGEPFRIVTDDPALTALTAKTVAGKRMQAIADPEVDGLRRLLCSEPRGHADMYGGFITAPDDDGAHFGDLGHDDDGNPVQRNVTVFADGEVDRSPCGSGTCARIATLAAQGRLGDDQHLIHHSVIGSAFIGRIIGHRVVEGRKAVTPVVTGTAYLTGEHVFSVDPDDDLTPGFVLR